MSPALVVVLVLLLGGVRTQPTGDEDRQTWSNPCLHYKCPGDSQCVSVTNGLLQLPVPHCVQKQQPHNEFEDDDEGCWGRDVGVSIVSCRTHHQWQAIASTTCGTSSLASIEVRHPCHRRDSTSPAIFLQAAISCCPEPVSSETPPTTAGTTPTFPTYYDAVSPSNDIEQQEDEEHDENDFGVGVVVIVTLGCLMVSSVIVLGVIKLFYDMRRKRSILHKPRLSFVTSYVNKSSDGWGEGCEGVRVGGGGGKPDFSYVVANGNHVY